MSSDCLVHRGCSDRVALIINDISDSALYNRRMALLANPAEQLEGRTLDGGWKVLRLIERPPSATGGCFSQSYVVESEAGKKAFLKALDFTAALRRSDDPARVLQALTAAYNYERDLLAACKEGRLTRVVMVIADGKVKVSDAVDGVVQYLIFEHAEGDARTMMDAGERFDTTLRLRALHHVATGLRQLHGIEVAHQDLKPSNVLMFEDGSKLADLGCASRKGTVGPLDHYGLVGDPAYAPPELAYYFVPEDWDTRRFACDLYLMGSMVVYFFTGNGMTPLWIRRLHRAHYPDAWTDGFKAVLPFIRDAFDSAVAEFRAHICHPRLADELVQVVRELCDPDPFRRGHPLNHAAAARNRYSLERYVTRFDLLAARSSLGMFNR